MGFWGNVGDQLKKAGQTIANEVRERQEIATAKRRILNRFEMKDLKKICKDYGIGEPSKYQKDIINGKKVRRKVTRDHYTNRIFYKLSLEQIKQFCEKRRIKVKDVLPQKKAANQEHLDEDKDKTVTTIEIKRRTEFESILECIQDEFEADTVRDEREFEKLMSLFLRMKYGSERVDTQVGTSRGKIDIVIDNKYAFELKIAEKVQVLRNLIGQAIFYKKSYPDTAVVLLDAGKLSHRTIKEFVDEYESNGIRAAVLNGSVRRQRKKSKQINIKF